MRSIVVRQLTSILNLSTQEHKSIKITEGQTILANTIVQIRVSSLFSNKIGYLEIQMLIITSRLSSHLKTIMRLKLKMPLLEQCITTHTTSQNNLETAITSCSGQIKSMNSSTMISQEMQLIQST